MTGVRLDPLLARLESDDEFRARVAAAPALALSEYGVEVGPTDVAGHVSLPPKRALRTARERLLAGRLSREAIDAAARAKFAPLGAR